MARLLPLILCLVTLTAFAGCTGTETAAPPAAPVGDAAPTVSNEGATVPSATSASAPAEGTVALAVATCQVTVHAGAGAANGQGAFLGCRLAKASPDVAGFASALLEARWGGTAAVGARYLLHATSDACDVDDPLGPCWLAATESATPDLRLVLSAETLAGHGADGLRARTSVDGVVLQQEVVVAVTLVPHGVVLPEGYSGLP